MKEKKNKKLLPVLIPLAAVLCIAAAAAYVATHYALAGGHLYPVTAEELDLRGTGVTKIVGLTRCEELRRLDLRGNDIDPTEVTELRTALPECEVLWDIPLGGERRGSDTETMELADVPEDWENLLLFPALRSLTISACDDPEAVEAVRAALSDCDVRWNVPLGDTWYPMDTAELTIPAAGASAAELTEKLPHFTALKRVTVEGCPFTRAEELAIAAAAPAVSFRWEIPVGDGSVPNDTAELFASELPPCTVEELQEVCALMPGLVRLDLSGCSLTGAERQAFREANTELAVGWTVEIEGESYDETTEEIDLSGKRIADLAALEDAVSYLPSLHSVIMCDCGISNEEMDALNRRHENISFVWRVYFSSYSLRTDAKYFIAAEQYQGGRLYDSDTEALKYCTALEGLDCGHMYFSDLSFLSNMPHMKYLILAECPIYDISVLSELKELRYLEIFSTPVSDISPLLECKGLLSLNICYTEIPQSAAWEVLSQMTWLQRLWYCNPHLSKTQISQLQERMPECIFFMLPGGESSGGSWRYDWRYYEMRDFFEMYYMPGGTNGVDEDGAQIIIDDWGQEFHLWDYDGGPYWWQEEKYIEAGFFPHIIGVTC